VKPFLVLVMVVFLSSCSTSAPKETVIVIKNDPNGESVNDKLLALFPSYPHCSVGESSASLEERFKKEGWKIIKITNDLFVAESTDKIVSTVQLKLKDGICIDID
jgi:hypothetical protein